MTWATRSRPALVALAMLAITVSSMSGANALDAMATLELEGNVADDTPADPPFDWASLFDASGNPIAVGPPLAASAFVSDAAVPDASYHTGSDTDTQDMTEWGCTSVNNPTPKNEILTAYGALFFLDGQTHLYLGVERADAPGTTFFGFWLTQNAASCDTFGTVGHEPNDLLVRADLEKGQNVVALSVYRWNPDADDNLELLVERYDCMEPHGADEGCGRVNVDSFTTPWGTEMGEAQFFEAAINLDLVFASVTPEGEDPVVPCYQTFMAETRASARLTATLKDVAAAHLTDCPIPPIPELSTMVLTGTGLVAVGALMAMGRRRDV